MSDATHTAFPLRNTPAAVKQANSYENPGTPPKVYSVEQLRDIMHNVIIEMEDGKYFERKPVPSDEEIEKCRRIASNRKGFSWSEVICTPCRDPDVSKCCVCECV